jgi:hypothetical protein
MKINFSIHKLNSLLIAIFFLTYNHSIALAQGEKNREALKINAGIFLINSNWTGQDRSQFVDLMGSLSISKPLTNYWDLGITSLFLKQLPKDYSYRFSNLDFFYFAGPFVRYYFNDFPLRPFWEGSFEYGNTCNCYFVPQFINDQLFLFDSGFYLGNTLGLETKIGKNVFIKLNLKAYYLFNEAENKGLIVRPFLNFSFLLPKKSILAPPVINNPRF